MGTHIDRAGRPLRTGWKPLRPPANKGKRYHPNPPSPVEIRRAHGALGKSAQDRRLAALIAVLWRAGLGLTEALTLGEYDCDSEDGIVIVRGRRKAATRKAVMDAWGFEHVAQWQEIRCELPAGPLFCVLRGPTRGQDWSKSQARGEIRRLGEQVGVKRFTPQQLRYAHAAELLIQGVSLAEAYRQLGLSTARNNRAPALMQLSGGGRHASEALTPPDAEKILRRHKGVPSGKAYSLVRRAAQTTDDAYREARTRAAQRAWSDATRALHEAEEKIMHAAAEDYGTNRE